MLRRLVWVLCAHAGALALFTAGFFLTRFEVADVSACGALPGGDDVIRAHLRRRPHDDAHNDDDADDTSCWLPRRYTRVVFVVIDALRYDFVADDGNGDKKKSDGRAFFVDHLPVFRDTLARLPQHALLLKFVADPPTMTMQRLKGLTTGSLPTFLDIKDNMASAEIAEDNLLRQMRARRRGVVFMGDDTWDGLYAREFTRKYAFDSFNVKDLDSVDRGVERHLFPELRHADWGLLIAHFLGVDHVGHTHGPSSPFMTKKLRETNAVLAKLIAEVETMDDTLLAVMGDHGMSADGNHGGASDDETGAALFLFSKKPLVGEGAENDGVRWPTEVPQVDLVPTLTLLSGLPIPFGNLGSVIPQLFFTASSGGDGDGDDRVDDRLASFRNLNQALTLNVDQVRRYLFRYSRASKLPEREYDALEQIYREITQLKAQLQEDAADQELHLRLVTRQQEFLREALSLGRSIWTQFDFCSMGWGIFFLVWSLGLVVVDSGDNGVEDHFPLASSATGALVGLFFPALDAVVPILPAAATSRAGVVALLFGLTDSTLRLRLPSPSVMKRSNSSGLIVSIVQSLDASTVVAFTLVLLHLLALLSNSYIVAEDKVTTFLAVTVGFFQLFQSQRKSSASAASIASCLVLIASTRLTSALEPPNIIQNEVSLLRTVLPLAAIVALAFLSTVVCTGSSPLASSSRVQSMFVALAVSCTSCAVYWCLSPSDSAIVRLWLPRFVFLAALGGMAIQLRSTAQQQKGITSLRFVITGEYVLMAFLVVPAFVLVLGPKSPLSVLLLVLQCISFAAILALGANRDAKTTVSQTLLWSTVCCQSFFFTGHQNTFTSLQNAAGFVGFDTFEFYRAGALLGLNTFGSYLLWLLFLPLALARPQTQQQTHQQQQRHHSDERQLDSDELKRSSATVSGRMVVTRACWRRAVLAVSLHFVLNAIVSTVFVALQRRHLMVWAIFAPKFIFDGATLLVVELLLALVSTLAG